MSSTLSRRRSAPALLPLVACLLLVARAGASPWTHHAVEGEDATSVHHYFYLEAEGSVERVRWVWNGGAQNAPTVTDYLISKGKIVVRHYQGAPETIDALVAGKDFGLTLTKEVAIRTGGKPLGEVLRRRMGLSKADRGDLESLAGILEMERSRLP